MRVASRLLTTSLRALAGHCGSWSLHTLEVPILEATFIGSEAATAALYCPSQARSWHLHLPMCHLAMCHCSWVARRFGARADLSTALMSLACFRPRLRAAVPLVAAANFAADLHQALPFLCSRLRALGPFRDVITVRCRALGGYATTRTTII